MKLLACDICHGIVPLIQKRVRSCRCGNIRGKYIDKRNIKVIVKDKKSSRILGLDNWVRYGFKKESKVWIIPWDNETVMLKEKSPA